ncbi:unnamed protein product (macronuclear) [Paramecium tetraurelia]|uniref:Cullin family profile domain-containing protein n=1 Tax=Paramecium tetraurelia TaxID=5888 RepID=A0DI48_PARTE|nr:uncharacterized protein GSPATT00017086001 [Paramecium tetraurelia]CAK82715.1 unnamed protein product [Paramecium tetraurelia]|eukprot:XP_001450112.1 hypothetical protein (macronuclear) [Paramecium tetraurelia strain d4-2]
MNRLDEHQLQSFINSRMQFGDLKYKTLVESLLFDQDNQELITKIYHIFQKHIQLFQILKQNNLLEDHINAVISKQILGDGMIEKKLISNKFVTGFQKLFGQNQYALALATIKLKNHMINTLRNVNAQDTAIDELFKDKEIHIQLDLEETKTFMTKINQDQQFDFIRNYIHYNLYKNQSFDQNLKLWKKKFQSQNNNLVLSNITIQIHFIDWIDQVKQIIERLWMPYCSHLDEIRLAETNDPLAFKPLQFISDIYEKKKTNFFIIDSLMNHINNHEYNFDKIQVAFSHKNPKAVLISFLELLDWCNDIQKWEKIIFTLVQNIKMEYVTTQPYQDSFRDGGFVMENYLDAILQNIITLYEKVDQQKEINFFDVDCLDESNFEGVLYEIKNDGLDFYDDKQLICGCVTFKLEQQSQMDGKIGQAIMDLPAIQKINIQVSKITQEYLLPLWENNKLKPKVIKLVLFRIAQCIRSETQKKDRSENTIHLQF